MPEVRKASRIRAFVRALPSEEWFGQAGHWFREVIHKVARFGTETLHLDEKLKDSYDAAWIKVEGSFAGKDNADAVLAWQTAENRKIEAKIRSATADDKIHQQRILTD